MISSSEQYFSASGQGPTEEEAKATATAALVSQISSFVTTRTDMRTSIENQIKSIKKNHNRFRKEKLHFDKSTTKDFLILNLPL